MDINILEQPNLYLHGLAVEDAIGEYLKKGYEVTREAKVGQYNTDLLAKKDDKKIYIEVKVAGNTKQNDRLINIKNAIQTIPNAEFRVIYVTPPKKKTIEIADVESSIHSYLIENIPAEIEILATHVKVEDIDHVEITDIRFNSEEIEASGTLIVGFTFQYGSNGDLRNDMGLETYESFSGTFDITLDRSLEIIEADFNFDTSDWFGEEDDVEQKNLEIDEEGK